MNIDDLKKWLCDEIESFPAKVSLLMVDLNTGKPLIAIDENAVVSAASTIKLGILISIFEQAEKGEINLNDEVPLAHILPDSKVFEKQNLAKTFPIWELAYWMITISDNTATNMLIDRLGMDCVNDTLTRWGTQNTVLQRKMLDWDAIKAGRNNLTTAHDQWKLYCELYKRASINEFWQKALDVLLSQRGNSAFMRYLNGPIRVAHKTGGLDYVSHDAGLFLCDENPFYLGIFTWDGPSLDDDEEQDRFIGKLTKKIYNECVKTKF